MAEYSKEKLYYFKMPAVFFEGHRMRILESMPKGKEAELIYLKLICESVSHNGYLRFSEETPYTTEMIAAITNATIPTVQASLVMLEKLELLTYTEDGTIFLPQVPKLTGSTTEGAERKRIQRRTKGGQKGDKCPPEYRDKSLENKSLDIRDKNLDISPVNTISLSSYEEGNKEDLDSYDIEEVDDDAPF